MKLRKILAGVLTAAMLVTGVVPGLGTFGTETVKAGTDYTESKDYGDDPLVVDGSASWNTGTCDNFTLTSSNSLTYVFYNEPFIKNTDNWSNFIIESVADSNAKGITLRADAYGWTYGDAVHTPSYVVTQAPNWTTFQTDCAKTYVFVNIRWQDANNVVITIDFANDNKEIYTINYPEGIPATTKWHIGADGGKISTKLVHVCTAVSHTGNYTITGTCEKTWKCSDCQTVLLKLGQHKYGVVENDSTNATYTTDGTYKYVCSVCDDVKNETIKPLLYLDFESDTESGNTYTEDGVTFNEVSGAKLQSNPETASDTALYLGKTKTQDKIEGKPISGASYIRSTTTPFSDSDFTNGFTISMNIRPSKQNTCWDYIFALGYTDPNYRYIDANIGYTMRSGDPYHETSKFETPFLTEGAYDKWYNLTMVYSKDAYIVYLDGTPVMTYDASAFASDIQSVFDVIKNGYLTLGGGINAGGLSYDGCQYSGYIDDVAIYNGALYATNVQELYGAKKITISGNSAVTSDGGTISLTTTSLPANNTGVTTWSILSEKDSSGAEVSTPGTIATINSTTGVVTANNNRVSGSITVQAKNGDAIATKVITVKTMNPITGASLSVAEGSSTTIDGNTKTTLIGNYVTGDGKETTDNYTISYISSNEKVAVVDENGVVTGKLGGTATITCTVEVGTQQYTAQKDITVSNKWIVEGGWNTAWTPSVKIESGSSNEFLMYVKSTGSAVWNGFDAVFDNLESSGLVKPNELTGYVEYADIRLDNYAGAGTSGAAVNTSGSTDVAKKVIFSGDDVNSSSNVSKFVSAIQAGTYFDVTISRADGVVTYKYDAYSGDGMYKWTRTAQFNHSDENDLYVHFIPDASSVTWYEGYAFSSSSSATCATHGTNIYKLQGDVDVSVKTPFDTSEAGHSYNMESGDVTPATCTDNEYTTYECTKCTKETENHTKIVEKEDTKLGHKVSSTTPVEVTEGLSAIDGAVKYYVCDRGDAYFADADGTKEVSNILFSESYDDASAENIEEYMTSVNAASYISVQNRGTESEQDNYIKWDVSNTTENERTAFLTFGAVSKAEKYADEYTVEFDFIARPGNDKESQIALTTAGYTKKNDVLTSNYVWSLNVTNSNGSALSTTWTINGDSAKTVTIPKDLWVHAKTLVNAKTGVATLMLLGEGLNYSTTVNFDAGTYAKGLHIRGGRYYETFCFDNVNVYSTALEPNVISSVDVTHTHTYDEGEVIVKPTCYATGVKKYTCTVEGCISSMEGHTKTEVLTKKDHSYNDGEITTPATCYAEGVKTYTCTNAGCTDSVKGHSYTEPIKKSDHSYNNGVVTTEPTCYREGVKTYTCTNAGCTSSVEGHSYTEPVKKAAHTYDKGVVITPATCTTDGLMEYTCTVEGCTSEIENHVKREKLSATGHKFTEFAAQAATCTEDGNIAYYVCDNCGIKVADKEDTSSELIDAEIIIPKTPHTWDDDTVYTDADGNELSADDIKGYKCTQTYYISGTCSVCGAGKDKEPETGNVHEYDEGKVTTAATCVSSGVKTYTCKACAEGTEGHTKTELIDKLQHEYGEGVVVKAATCEDEGEMLYTCTQPGCLATFENHTKTETIPATGHRYNSVEFTWADDYTATAVAVCENDDTHTIPVEGVTVTSEVTKAATCENKGEKTYTATVTYGGETYTDTKKAEIPAIGHNYAEVVFDWAVDNKSATAHYVCANDAAHTKDATVEMSHETTTAAGCETAGVETYTATVKDAEGTVVKQEAKTVSIPALGHDYIRTVTAPTCSEKGYTTVTCSRCDYSEKTDEKPATGIHTYDEGTVTKEATCTTEGVLTKTCTVCHGTKEEKIPATGVHTFDEGKVTTEATCTTEGILTKTCTGCQETKEEKIPAKGHTLVKTEAKAATETAEGNIEYYTCSVCKKYYSDAQGTKEITLAGTVIPKLPASNNNTNNGNNTSADSNTNNSTTTADKQTTTTKTVKVSAPKISKLTNKKTRKLVVQYKKVSKAVGYQIQYSTKKNFKGAKSVKVKSAKTTSVTIEKLTKKKTYYVRVRAYAKSGKKTVYSAWSKVKSVKIKK